MTPEEIRRISIEMTLVDGEIAFKREGKGKEGGLDDGGREYWSDGVLEW